MTDLGLLILPLTVGTLLAGHGSQKLFGWFGGPGLKGTHGFMESLGLKPGKIWGTMAETRPRATTAQAQESASV